MRPWTARPAATDTGSHCLEVLLRGAPSTRRRMARGEAKWSVTPLSPNTTRDHDIRGEPILGGPDSHVKGKRTEAMP